MTVSAVAGSCWRLKDVQAATMARSVPLRTAAARNRRRTAPTSGTPSALATQTCRTVLVCGSPAVAPCACCDWPSCKEETIKR